MFSKDSSRRENIQSNYRKNKMLTSAMFLHFGAFHNCPLLLIPCSSGTFWVFNPWGNFPSLFPTGDSAGPIWGYLSWGTQKGHHDPTSINRKQEKAAFWKPKLPFPPEIFPNPEIPVIRGIAGSRSCPLSTELTPPHHYKSWITLFSFTPEKKAKEL